MLQVFKVFLPIGGFSLCLLLLVPLLVFGVKLSLKAKDLYISVFLMTLYSLVLFSGRLGFWSLELGSFNSSYALLLIFLVQSLVLIFYRIYVFPAAVFLSYMLYFFNGYNSAIFSLYLADGLTLFCCIFIVCIYKFKKTSIKKV